MLRTTIALAALTLVVSAAEADVYKTVDAQGQPHYSDQWSPGAVLIKSSGAVRSDASPTPAPPAPAPNDHTLAPDPARTAAAKQVQADVQAIRAEQCKQLKDQYDKLIHARRVYAPNADPNAPRQYMSDADADAERVKTRQAMEEACAGESSG